MQKRTRMAALVAVVVGSPAALCAADGAPGRGGAVAGVEVRVSVNGRWARGYLAGQDENGLTLAVPSEHPFAPATEFTIPRESVSRVEVYAGQKRHAKIGALVGAIAFGLTGLREPINQSPDCTTESAQACSRGEAVLIDALAGALLGALVGQAVKTDHWTAMPVSALTRMPPSLAEVHKAPGGPSLPAPVTPPVHWTLRF
jgi:hypothetical protein